MRHIPIIAKKDLRGLMNERTILLAVLLQLFIAMFSSFLMVGLTSLYDPSSLSRYSRFEYAVGYAGNDSPLRTYINQSRDFRVYDMDLPVAIQALRERKLAAVVYYPETPPDAAEPVKITFYTLQNDIQAAIVNVKLKDIFVRYENELRTVRSDRLNLRPVVLQFPVTGSGADFYEFIYGLLIPMLVFMPAIISSALIIDFITEEYQNGTFETLIAAPLRNSDIVWGKVLACTVLVPVQAVIWLVLLSANRIPVLHIPEIVAHITAFAMILILIGAITALYYRERTAAQFVYSTAIVVVILVMLAIPGNPLNMITRLATGSAGPEQWAVLALVLGIVALLAVATDRYAKAVERKIKVA